MAAHHEPDRSPEQPLECDHCHYPIPGESEDTDDGRFCSTACLEAADDESAMPEPSAYKRIATGVEPLDSVVPNGVPADSFVCVSGDAGTRRSELLTELVWRALERGEPAVVITATTPPTAVLERFFENGWNVLPALEDDRLRLIDCFTHRLSDREDFLEHRSRWIEFVGATAAESIVAIEEPTELRSILTGLNEALGDLEMTETGLVTIDSLDEFEDHHLHEFITETRATVCKARYVPIVAGATAGNELDPGNESIFDGIVDLRLTDHLEPDVRHRQLSVRKLAGAKHLPQWLTYEYEPARGLFVSGPVRDSGQRAPGAPTPRVAQERR
ncbi:recombinase RecA [Natronorubrum sp. JWXQ-INN-674]|uniref:Recombinase RecA n=1 Tax=Natronorubrum halalkaliphilum TaxID=2691917 RepID=A0A6B0VKT3_9EURY|nr:ATPase domain-containing protein [Natronorubrum halalkaliphilum]MXV61717.1 recombinase RecA [Natronorubrum halalkaliphilum]